VILWLASYPRSGNSFLRVLLKVAFGISSDSIYPNESDLPWVREGLIPRRSLGDMARGSDLCAIKTHELPGGDEYPALYVVRDGRDAIVSYAHYALEVFQKATGAQQADSIPSMIRTLVSTDGHFGGWGRNVTAWASRKAPTQVIRFEELIIDPVTIVARALERLGIRPQQTGSALPTFGELRARAPEFFRVRRVGGYREEMPRALEDLFWSRSGGVMRRLGYPPSKREVDGPLVTIVTPSFCQGAFIRDTIESVLVQDYPHIEHLIMDGGSTDETPAIVAEYSDHVTWISEKDSRSIRRHQPGGFRRAKGDIVCWLNSDDLLMPRAVSRAVTELAQDADLKAVCGDAYRIDHGGGLIGEFPKTVRPTCGSSFTTPTTSRSRSCFFAAKLWTRWVIWTRASIGGWTGISSFVSASAVGWLTSRSCSHASASTTKPRPRAAVSPGSGSSSASCGGTAGGDIPPSSSYTASILA
jgi:Glycosyl transferase family 2/Sulfotransferase domain